MRLGGAQLNQAIGQPLALRRQGMRAALAASAVAFAMTFLQHAEDGTGQTTYTFSAQNLGTADSTRKILALVSYRASVSRTISSVTIGGVAASVVVGDVSSSAGLTCYVADVPSGATGDVVVTLSGAGTHASIELYRIVGGGATYSSRSGANCDVGASVNSQGSTATVPTGGVGVAAVRIAAATGGPVTWSGTATLNERVDEQIGTTSFWVSVVDTTDTGAITFTADGADAQPYRTLAVAWGPA